MMHPGEHRQILLPQNPSMGELLANDPGVILDLQWGALAQKFPERDFLPMPMAVPQEAPFKGGFFLRGPGYIMGARAMAEEQILRAHGSSRYRYGRWWRCGWLRMIMMIEQLVHLVDIQLEHGQTRPFLFLHLCRYDESFVISDYAEMKMDRSFMAETHNTQQDRSSEVGIGL